MAEYQEFPRMIYHAVEEPKIVNDKKELEYHLERGWSRTPQEFSEIAAVLAKMDYHRAEFERLAEILANLEQTPKSDGKKPDSASCASTGGKKEGSPDKVAVKKGV